MNLVMNLRRNIFKLDRHTIGIFLVYLFHISAIIGAILGHEDWFIPKTPLNLSIIMALMIWLFPIDSNRKIMASLIFFLTGVFVEWLGVNFSLLFGTYQYGENLGPKVGGVPALIGVNWTVLVFISGEISNKIHVSRWFKILIGASLMLFLDFFMEVPAPHFDFWIFEGGIAPPSNYIAWFAIAALLHMVFQFMKIEGNFKFSLHLYICQLLFFAFFYAYYSL